MKYEKFIYTDDQSYCSSNSKFFLSNQIHLWKIPLDNFHQVQQSWSYLQKEEQKRASLLKVNSAFSRYIICRGAVRNILSMYLDILPQKIIINYEKHGKPYIFYPSTRLCFNVSHSSSCAILSIAYNKPIGIDIELVHPIDEIYSLSEIIFSDNEIIHFKNLYKNSYLNYFYLIWTSKEAFLKALGIGLNYPLHNIDFSSLNLDSYGRFSTIIPEALRKNWEIYRYSEKYLCAEYQIACCVEMD